KIRTSSMKALILAAGSAQTPDSSAWLLQRLGDHAVIDYVLKLAQSLVAPSDIYVVVEQADNEIASHLGNQFQYVVQHERLGTGHAVLAAAEQMADYTGPLLI